MKQTIVILSILGILVLVVGVIVAVKSSKKGDTFDISVDPLKEGSYEYLNAVNCPNKPPCVINNTQYGGLNPEHNEYVTLEDFIETYGDCEDFSDPQTAKVVSQQYCQMLWPNHNEYFTGYLGYLSFGECEIQTEEKIKKMYPKTTFASQWSN